MLDAQALFSNSRVVAYPYHRAAAFVVLLSAAVLVSGPAAFVGEPSLVLRPRPGAAESIYQRKALYLHGKTYDSYSSGNLDELGFRLSSELISFFLNFERNSARTAFMLADFASSRPRSIIWGNEASENFSKKRERKHCIHFCILDSVLLSLLGGALLMEPESVTSILIEQITRTATTRLAASSSF